jgi:hypothetical protein
MAKINFKKITDRVQTAVVMGAGSVAANYVGNFVNKQFGSKATPVLTAGAKLALGAFLPSLVGGGKKAGMVTDFANGMLAEAAVSMAKALNLPGVHGIEVDTVSGDNWTPGGTVNGTNAIEVISGAAN